MASAGVMRSQVHSLNFAYGDQAKRSQVFDKIVEFIKSSPPPFRVAVKECESLIGGGYDFMVTIFFIRDPSEADDYFCEMISKVRPSSDHCGIDDHLRGDFFPYGRSFP